MKTSFTPGPWHEGSGNGFGSVFADTGRMRYENGTVLYPIATICQGWAENEDAANAKLIAAAPDLLQALQNIARSDEFNGGTFVLELQQIARDAIAKATGAA